MLNYLKHLFFPLSYTHTQGERGTGLCFQLKSEDRMHTAHSSLLSIGALNIINYWKFPDTYV